MAQNRLYFGYGSNLDWDDWKRFCFERGADPHGLMEREPAWLLGHHLKFHYYSSGRGGGAADVVPIDEYHATPGALFEVDDEAWFTLIEKEGAPRYYEEKEVLVVGQDGTIHQATTFTVCEHRQKPNFVCPTDEYQGLIRTGLEDRNLPTFGLDQAMVHRFDSPTINHLFIYGTLMTGQVRHQYLKPFILSKSNAKIRGVLHHLGTYPGMRMGDGIVHGELIHISDVEACLERMDGIEGFLGFGRDDSLFDRIIIQVQSDSGTVWAWTYVYSDRVGDESIINSGRWN